MMDEHKKGVGFRNKKVESSQNADRTSDQKGSKVYLY